MPDKSPSFAWQLRNRSARARDEAAAFLKGAAGAIAETSRVTMRYGSHHPSPNAGQCEAAFAGALGVRLGGTNVYHGVPETRPELGDGRPPETHDICRAIALSRAVTAATTAAAAITATALAAATTRAASTRAAAITVGGARLPKRRRRS